MPVLLGALALGSAGPAAWAITGLPGIKEPPDLFTADPAENRRSIRKLAELNSSLILPGHGPAVTDMAAFERFAAALPG